MKHLFQFFCLCLCIFALAACGKKGDPVPENPDSFPRAYPHS